jgi:hypothetical protein
MRFLLIVGGPLGPDSARFSGNAADTLGLPECKRGIAMNRLARAFVSVLLLAAAGLVAGCSSGGGLLTGSTPAADAPGAGDKVARRSEKAFDRDRFWEDMKSIGSQ